MTNPAPQPLPPVSDNPKISQPERSKNWLLHCPGCEIDHQLTPGWVYTGTTVKPTFRPSLLVNWADAKGKPVRCHSAIRDGVIHFMADSTHKLSGLSANLPDW